MDGILICTALLIAIALLRLRNQESDALAYAPVRLDSDDNSSADAICGGCVMMHESSFLANDDDWACGSATDDSPVSIGYESDTSADTSRWTDPTYAYEPDNVYHGTLIDPTYHDDSFASSSCFDDSFSSSSSDDGWSSSSFDDSFSSSGFND